MYEYILAALTGDKSKTFSVVEPLNCSLFHDSACSFSVDFFVRRKETGRYLRQVLAVERELLDTTASNLTQNNHTTKQQPGTPGVDSGVNIIQQLTIEG